MGWAGGSEVLGNVIGAVKRYIPPAKKKAVYRKLIAMFENEDCDTIEECTGIDAALDAVIEERIIITDWNDGASIADIADDHRIPIARVRTVVAKLEREAA